MRSPIPRQDARTSGRDATDVIANRLVMAAIRLTRTLRALKRSGRLSGPSISALAVIAEATRISARDLAALEEVSAAAISKLITQMETAGLVRRTPDRTDARRQWISLTAKGVRLVRQGHAQRIAPLASAIKALPVGRRIAVEQACALIEEMTKATRGNSRGPRAKLPEAKHGRAIRSRTTPW